MRLAVVERMLSEEDDARAQITVDNLAGPALVLIAFEPARGAEEPYERSLAPRLAQLRHHGLDRTLGVVAPLDLGTVDVERE